MNGVFVLTKYLIQYQDVNILSIDNIAIMSYLLDLPILCVVKIFEKIMHQEHLFIGSFIIEILLVIGLFVRNKTRL